MDVKSVNLPAQNNRYRGPIESAKLENSILLLAESCDKLSAYLSGLRGELERMNLHSVILYKNIYAPVPGGESAW